MLFRSTTTNLDERQGKVDGFNDAWDNRAINLSRFNGNNVRTAVDYARGYFEGYDRLAKGAVQAAFKSTPVLKATVAATTKKGNPALVGYNAGRRDAARGVKRNANSSAFDLADAVAYTRAYNKGYDSI